MSEPLNDIEATGNCCCNGCIGEGPCDLDPFLCRGCGDELPGCCCDWDGEDLDDEYESAWPTMADAAGFGY
jgi:hypothetical protein